MTRSAGVILLAAVVTSLATATSDAHTLPSSPLDGRWAFTWTPAEVKSHGADPRLADHYVMEFRNGSLIRLVPHPVVRKARFTVRGNVMSFVFVVPTTGAVVGRPYEMRWSIYRDRLSWAMVPGRAGADLFTAVPWTRVR
jgi:hypothetical protein